MFTFGFWFYHELQDKIGCRPAKQHGDPEDSFIKLETPNGNYDCKVSSYRMELFRQNPKCVSCERIGSLWILQSHHMKERPHLNLYHVGEEVQEWKKLSDNGLVMMTKDHIIPRSRGGPTNLENLQTMCAICNGKKGAAFMHEDHWRNTPGPNAQSEEDRRLRRALRIDNTNSKAEIQCLGGIPHFT